MKVDKKADYGVFQHKLMQRFCAIALAAFLVVIVFYLFILQQRVGNWIVGLLKLFMRIEEEEALLIYYFYFREYKEVFFSVVMIVVFIFLLWQLFRWMTRYFKEIDQGIDSLLAEDENEIHLSPEMMPFEKKLNTVKQTLAQRNAEARLAEQRKDDLVMYLAHDIRTPLTSVIGYLNLLEEEADMPADQREEYLQITLDKAYRLQKLVEEFFEITRYNLQQINLYKDSLDLYYMLLQLSDELLPVLSGRGNSVVLNVDENLTVYADADKLVRVFGNILKNAASYSYVDTEIIISAEKNENQVRISFQNRGDAIPDEKLALLFDKFYRLDASRMSGTGGTGLGLAIAKEIVALHGGTICAASKNGLNTFSVCLPAAN